jgi:hypothetical protein
MVDQSNSIMEDDVSIAQEYSRIDASDCDIDEKPPSLFSINKIKINSTVQEGSISRVKRSFKSSGSQAFSPVSASAFLSQLNHPYPPVSMKTQANTPFQLSKKLNHQNTTAMSIENYSILGGKSASYVGGSNQAD